MSSTPSFQLDGDDNACDFSSVKFSVIPVAHQSHRRPELRYPCEFEDCNENFTDLLKFTEHVSSHLPQVSVKDEEFTCGWRLCPFSSSNVKEFIRHFHFHPFHAKIKTEGKRILFSRYQKPSLRPCTLDSSEVNILPDLTDDFLCQWDSCSSPPFEEALKFYWHVQKHADEVKDSKACSWAHCSVRVKTVSKLKEHLKSHSQERVVACPTCGNLFANRSKFIDHCNRQLLPEDKSFECSYCSKTFAVERLLRDHIRSHINTKKCPLCEMTSTTLSNLRNHIRYRHSEIRQFPCSGCNYAAKSNYDLQSHIRSLHGRPQYKCLLPKCDYICDDKDTLFTHARDYHHGERGPLKLYLCHECDKRFERGQYLSRHLIRVHGLRTPGGHKRFRYKENANGDYLLQYERFDFLADDDEEEELEDSNEEDDVMEIQSNNMS